MFSPLLAYPYWWSQSCKSKKIFCILCYLFNINKHQQNATTYKEFGPSGVSLPDLLCPKLTNDQPVVNKQQIPTRQGC